MNLGVASQKNLNKETRKKQLKGFSGIRSICKQTYFIRAQVSFSADLSYVKVCFILTSCNEVGIISLENCRWQMHSWINKATSKTS